MHYFEGPRNFGPCLLAAALLLSFWAADATAGFTAIPQSDGVIRVVRSSSPSSYVSPRQPIATSEASDGKTGRTPPEILSLIRSISWRHGLDPAFVQALIKIESNFDPDAISPKGARGLMQLLPSTARLYGLRNYYDPAGNIDAGVRHLKRLFKRYNDEVDLVLAAYNAGPSAVDFYGGIPPYKETRRFIRKVKDTYRRLSSSASILSSRGAFSGSGGLRRSVRADGTIVIRAAPGGR